MTRYEWKSDVGLDDDFDVGFDMGCVWVRVVDGLAVGGLCAGCMVVVKVVVKISGKVAGKGGGKGGDLVGGKGTMIGPLGRRSVIR